MRITPCFLPLCIGCIPGSQPFPPSSRPTILGPLLTPVFIITASLTSDFPGLLYNDPYDSIGPTLSSLHHKTLTEDTSAEFPRLYKATCSGILGIGVDISDTTVLPPHTGMITHILKVVGEGS